jgi:tryptophanyl-tRNA synthetase
MRILTGIQPSGQLHIGNYFGAMQPSIALQEQGETFLFIADYHSMTSLFDAEKRRAYVRDVALDFLACGLDPRRTVFFRQSDVPEVCELSWLLSTVTSLGLLERAHSFKDKVARGLPVCHGLFAYPVLMAADILLYDAQQVPVGKDQKQHLEITRDVALKFNQTYGETFVIPDPVINESVAVVPGLDGGKMSKSQGNTLEIFGDEKITSKRIMGMVMDSRPPAAPKPDAEKNLAVQLMKVLSPEVGAEYEEKLRVGGLGYGDLKKQLFAVYWEHFAPMRARRAELASDPAQVEAVLKDGAERARAVASGVLKRARRACGID